MPLFGLLNVHKPSGVTSRDVVNQVQRLVRPAKVGHAGTLDPLASGVLVIGLGQATRLVEYIQQMPKRYRAMFLLGRSSPTEDIEGEVALLPEATEPTAEQLAAAARSLKGEIEQRPPAYSAIKVGGRRAYALARAGAAVELAARKICVHALEITRYEYPELSLEIECSSGTYVRSLGRDLAELVGAAAVMASLARTAIGPFKIEDAIEASSLSRDSIAGALLSPTLAIRGLLCEQAVQPEDQERLRHGLSIHLTDEREEQCAAVDVHGQLVAILCRRGDGTYGPMKFFPRS